MMTNFQDIMSTATLVCTIINVVVMIPLWWALYYKNKKLRKEIKQLDDRHIQFLEMGAKLFPSKVYLVWLTNQEGVMALVGCCSSEQKAIAYIDGKEHYIQEIEVK